MHRLMSVLFFLSFLMALSPAHAMDEVKDGLHPKINRQILINGNLIQASKWPKAIAQCSNHLSKQATTKFSEKAAKNHFGVSLLRDKTGYFIAVHPGAEAILGTGQEGTVRLGQLINVGKIPNLDEAPKKGQWVAIKFQKNPFEPEEIVGLKRTKLFICGPIYYQPSGKELRYACVQILINGKTADDWLESRDPTHLLTFVDFEEIANKLFGAIIQQVHANYMVIHDSNLANFMIKDNSDEIVAIDFGNAIIFEADGSDRKTPKFQEYCLYDGLLLLNAIHSFLEDTEYPAAVCDAFWAYSFFHALNAYQNAKAMKHDLSVIAIHKSAFAVWKACTQGVLPEFVEDALNDAESQSDHEIDSLIVKIIRNHLPDDMYEQVVNCDSLF